MTRGVSGAATNKRRTTPAPVPAPTPTPARPAVTRPLGVALFALLIGYLGLMSAFRGAEGLLAGSKLIEGIWLEPYALLIFAFFGFYAAVSFFRLRPDGWTYMFIAAIFNPSLIITTDTERTLVAAVCWSLLVYLFTPEVKRLYKSTFGPTL